ncbi:Protease [Rhodovastum atsumiense]|uniref:Protease n=1 Tax=Rhodovastum atsumiense TaxID=504468 RepID=A0A5M6IQW1_9PROT|nr:protease [Rhodovastum atsumiense]KAA5610676.1 protease [Rhodovastum atsumiense]CAH2603329.1 Protease [Rhodovastum atsumiense]
MTELLLLLIGAQVVREKWRTIGYIGLAWLLVGAFFFVDALLDEFRIWPVYFAIPLLLDAGVSFVAGLSGIDSRRGLRFAKAAILAVISLLIILRPWGSDIVIGFLVGILLVLDAGWRAASATVVRFPRWRGALGVAVFEFALGVWSFVPWPTGWQGEVGLDVGTLMMVTAISLLVLAWRIRRLPAGMPMSRLLSDGWPRGRWPDAAGEAPVPAMAGNLVVHVWTPTGSLAPLRHGIARYVAALDEKGVISTGHAALEAPDVYISHYPAADIDRDQSAFTRTLRATVDNDVPGRFLPGYAEESGEWCPSTVQVELRGLDLGALRAFWEGYRQDTTYNLTRRNCSTAVARALDAAVEGCFAGRARSPWFLLRLLVLPELWTAGLIRRRAAAMAWTPGLMLDYARALAGVLDLPARAGGRAPVRAVPAA